MKISAPAPGKNPGSASGNPGNKAKKLKLFQGLQEINIATENEEDNNSSNLIVQLIIEIIFYQFNFV